MIAQEKFTVLLTDWHKHAERLKPVRLQVFVEEQGVPPEVEMDAHDAECVHAMALDASGKVVGTGRLLPAEERSARIGRMAVYRDWRGRGVGEAMLFALMDAARDRGDREIVLHAQLHAAPFYDRHGYEQIGAVYEEAGIPHVTMRKAL
jgi:predicted GNAT family N-acyltransferase